MATGGASAGPVRVACLRYLHTAAVCDAAEFRCVWTGPTVHETTLALVRGEVDAAEVSLATLLRVQDRHVAPLLALPVFPRRTFLQPYMICSAGSPLSRPGDLEGRRVAVPRYWRTSSLWHRWVLERCYGLPPDAVTWCPLQRDHIDDVPRPGPPVDLGVAGRAETDVLLSGAADVLLTARRPPDMRHLRCLFADEVAESLAFHAATGWVPALHVVAVHERLACERPEAVVALQRLFERSLDLARSNLAEAVHLLLPFADRHMGETGRLLGGSSWNAYGWRANEPMLRTFHGAAVAEGWISGAVSLEASFLRP